MAPVASAAPFSETNFGSLEPFLFSLHMGSPEPSIRNTKYECGGFVLVAGPPTRKATYWS